MFGLTRYQRLVLFAAWLGWGFDVFDGLLFNYVAPICVPNLLGIPIGAPSSSGPTLFWTGALTSLLLLGWATGGILFGKITDRIGRTRTLTFTMLTYAAATAACALTPKLPHGAGLGVLAVARFVASLGIGGEWAAGASLVAETLPREKRVIGGALLYTSAPAGLFLATFVNDVLTRRLAVLAQNPDLSWRVVFLTGIVPALVALGIRTKVKESELWKPDLAPRIRELFAPELRTRAIGGLCMAIIALVTWWSCSAFIPVVASHLAGGPGPQLPQKALSARRTEFITIATTAFNLGGLIGTLLTVPVANRLGRRPMFLLYFCASAVAVLTTFGLPMAATTRLWMMFGVGLTVFGVFGSFTFYLPELFPVRLRGTGSGFCYNAGRVVTSAFPFAVAYVGRARVDPLPILTWVALAPALGVVLVAAGLGVETRLADAE